MTDETNKSNLVADITKTEYYAAMALHGLLAHYGLKIDYEAVLDMSVTLAGGLSWKMSQTGIRQTPEEFEREMDEAIAKIKQKEDKR